jgi:hypothetical protein
MILIYTLLPLFISGLTFLAYKHYDDFKKFSNILSYVTAILTLVIIGWNTILSFVTSQILIKCPERIISDELVKHFEEYQFPLTTVFTIYILFAAYMIFLISLPLILKDHPKRRERLTKQK